MIVVRILITIAKRRTVAPRKVMMFIAEVANVHVS